MNEWMNKPPSFAPFPVSRGPWLSLEKYLVGLQLLWFPGPIGPGQSQPGLGGWTKAGIVRPGSGELGLAPA